MTYLPLRYLQYVRCWHRNHMRTQTTHFFLSISGSFVFLNLQRSNTCKSLCLFLFAIYSVFFKSSSMQTQECYETLQILSVN